MSILQNMPLVACTESPFLRHPDMPIGIRKSKIDAIGGISVSDTDHVIFFTLDSGVERTWDISTKERMLDTISSVLGH